jgi:hypothetical protein
MVQNTSLTSFIGITVPLLTACWPHYDRSKVSLGAVNITINHLYTHTLPSQMQLYFPFTPPLCYSCMFLLYLAIIRQLFILLKMLHYFPMYLKWIISTLCQCHSIFCHPFIKDICLSALFIIMFSHNVFLLWHQCFLYCVMCAVLMTFIIVNFYTFDSCLVYLCIMFSVVFTDVTEMSLSLLLSAICMIVLLHYICYGLCLYVSLLLYLLLSFSMGWWVAVN